MEFSLPKGMEFLLTLRFFLFFKEFLSQDIKVTSVALINKY